MRELDFLPVQYVAAVRRRQQNRRNSLLSVGLLLAMISLHMLNATRVRSAEAALAALENGSGGWGSAREQLADLERRRTVFRQRAALISRLDDAAPLDAAIGELSLLLNDSMAVRSVNIEAPGSAAAAGTAAIPPVPSPAAAATRATIVGVAANDIDVGIFLGKLASCPLFADAALSYTREMRSSGRLMREFEVKFTLRPVEATP